MIEMEKIKDLNKEELGKKLSELRLQHKDLRFQKARGELKNPLKLREIRRDVARIMTVINEKGRGK
jgi:large subunit ribosomal protein L29